MPLLMTQVHAVRQHQLGCHQSTHKQQWQHLAQRPRPAVCLLVLLLLLPSQQGCRAQLVLVVVQPG